jgi:hypothetical protein
MGVYATAAIVVSLLYYMSNRYRLRLYSDKQDRLAPKKTNFHEEMSYARPMGGIYYNPSNAYKSLSHMMPDFSKISLTSRTAINDYLYNPHTQTNIMNVSSF